jgi:hypothetical protein
MNSGFSNRSTCSTTHRTKTTEIFKSSVAITSKIERTTSGTPCLSCPVPSRPFPGKYSHSSVLTCFVLHRYNRLVGSCKKLAHKLSMLDPTDPYRVLHEQRLLRKLYNAGVINSTTPSLSEVQNELSVSSFCRRRIGVVMARLRMCETV